MSTCPKTPFFITVHPTAFKTIFKQPLYSRFIDSPPQSHTLHAQTHNLIQNLKLFILIRVYCQSPKGIDWAIKSIKWEVSRLLSSKPTIFTQKPVLPNYNGCLEKLITSIPSFSLALRGITKGKGPRFPLRNIHNDCQSLSCNRFCFCCLRKICPQAEPQLFGPWGIVLFDIPASPSKEAVAKVKQQQLIRNFSLQQTMKSRNILMTLAIMLSLISLGTSIGCQYFTASSCTAVGCTWSNNTCILGTGVCKGGWAYSSSIQECVECSTLASSNCTTICSTYFYSATNSLCQSCTGINDNCLTCSETQCYSCQSGFSVDPAHSKQCLIDFCKIRFCESCDSNSTCYLCKTGYYSASNETICSAAACSIDNCLYCYDSTECVTCQSGYQLSQSGTACTAICVDPFCQSCSSPTVCTSCLSGYNFNTNTGYCQLLCLVPQCSTCDLSTTCSSCASGYSVNFAYTLCNPICTDTNCATCTTPSNCTNCRLGFTFVNGSCTQAICFIDNCLNCQTTILCATCSSITTISSDSRSCVQNCLASIANCRTCATNTTCSACRAGFELATDARSCRTVCSVANCQVCLTSSLCNFCQTGYIASSGGTTCAFNCGILNCATCNSTTTCSRCNSPFTLSSASTSCRLTCSPGFYLNSTSNTCQSCSSAKSNCQTCTLSVNSNVICSQCQDLFFLTSTGDCASCSSRISNCLLCTSPVACTSCRSGYNLAFVNNIFGCVLPYTCNVSSCLLCSSNNPQICTQCESAYFLSDSNNLTCSRIQCLDTQYYDSNTLSCTCPFGTFLINKKCSYCSIDKCDACNSGGCISCKTNYYIDQGACYKCPSHCFNCTSGSSCLECDYGFSLQVSGACKKADDRYSSTIVGNTNAEAICPPGCFKCSYFQGNIFCTIAKDGYAIDPTGSVIKCSDSCLTCANTDYTVCTSCYGSSVLISGICAGCTDLYALTCPSNIKYSTSCFLGYSPINGVCRKCADNCLTCGQAGAASCDNGGCGTGYVKLEGTNNCTRCFSSCATCSTNNPSSCLTCGNSNFLSNTSSCESCPSACQTCSSSTVCLTCPATSTFENGWCYTTIPSPCSSQTQNTCTECYYGFNLINGACIVDNSCNGTRTCSVCDKGNYLSGGQCFVCSTDSTCDYCQPSAPTKCLYCASGYYLRRNDVSCRTCSSAQTGCRLCESAQLCTQAADGYYLEVNIRNKYTGKVQACKEGCAICSSSSGCNTCASDYNKIGTSCIYSKYVQAKLALSAGPGSQVWFNANNTDQQNLANAFLKLNQILSSLASVSGITNPERLLIKSLMLGSLLVDVIMAGDPNENINDMSNKIVSNMATLPDFNVLSSSITVTGASTAMQSANLGLILGITIPLLVLLIVIIIFMKVYMGDSDEKSTQETEKEIQEIQM